MAQRSNRRSLKLSDGNVGAEATRRGFGDIRLWVAPEGQYKQHSLFITLEEAERLSDLLVDLLDELRPEEDAG